MIRRVIGPIIVIALLALLALGLLRPRDGNDPIVGQIAPTFTLQNIDGGRIDLAQFKGRPVIVNFFASWCEPCKYEAPLLRQAVLTYAPKGVMFLGIAYNDKPADARKFRDEYGLGFPMLLDDDQSRASVAYGLVGVPETYFINRAGRILSRHKGQLMEADLEAGLKAILE